MKRTVQQGGVQKEFLMLGGGGERVDRLSLHKWNHSRALKYFGRTRFNFHKKEELLVESKVGLVEDERRRDGRSRKSWGGDEATEKDMRPRRS